MYVAYFPCTGSVQLLTNILWHCDSTVTETMYLILIKKHHFANYNSTSGDYPTVICPSCKRCLRDRDKFGHDAKGKLPPLRYHKMRGTSRNFDECQCSWCPGVRSRVIEHVPAPPPEVKEICQGCLGEKKRGVLTRLLVRISTFWHLLL